MEDVLFFSTGVKEMPAVGFAQTPSIEFLHEAEGDGVRSSFPKANTCSCTLKLPVVHDTYKSFAEAMIFAMLNTQGFGFA